jgi:predicted RNase H-like nuclease (RuvC/YqgF family)
MKRFSLILTLVMAVMFVQPGRAQDAAALDERMKRLTGYVQDLQEDNANQKKQIEALVREIQSLREQVQSQPKTAAASPDDLRELAKKIQEVDEKRKADYELIAKEIKDLAKIAANSRTVRAPRAESGSSDKPMADLPKQAMEHTIASGDTLLAIALAYSKETGKKVTTDMILRANDGLKAERLIVGKKILIPIPDK